jgi:hypothetical protein
VISVSLKKRQPYLEGVFGPLSDEAEIQVRSTLSQVDEVLLQLARHFGHERAGWERTGLDLQMVPSGQISIASFVEASDPDGNVASFILEVRPSWFYGVRTGDPGWQIESTIDVDLESAPGHSQMGTVHQVADIASASPTEAALALLDTARQLLQLGTTYDISHWTAMGRNEH